MQGSNGTWIGLDLNSSRVRAVRGVSGRPPHVLPLDGDQEELPLALSLQGRTPLVGRPGLNLCRCLPHLSCIDFLPSIGKSPTWKVGRHRLDATRALALVLKHLQPACAASQGAFLALPSYLSSSQIELVAKLAEEARLRIAGWMPAVLANAWTAYAEQSWRGLALLIDVDSHALTYHVVSVDEGQLRVMESSSAPHLSLRAWKDHILNALADRCIQYSRRDPRASAVAEQSLYEQIDKALDTCLHGHDIELLIQMTNWYQNLILRPEELSVMCEPLARQTVEALASLRTTSGAYEFASTLLVTASVGRLPGLAAALEESIHEPGLISEIETSPDFGEDLFENEHSDWGRLRVLGPDAAAIAAHELALSWQHGRTSAGWLSALPAPPPQPASAGQPRLQFRGQEFPLATPTFTLGRHTGSNLVFNGDQYPTVALHHCEIVLDHPHFLLRDHNSRTGTFINERPAQEPVVLHPGDWIRLGHDGPLLRFLGQVLEVYQAKKVIGRI